MTKKNNPKNYKNISKKPNSKLYNEILLILTICVNIFLAIAVFFNKGGIIGTFFSSILKGLFGIGAYCLPIIIATYFILKFLNNKNKLILLKFIPSVTIIFLTMTLFHIIFNKYTIDTNYFEYLKSIYINSSLLSGGIIGGVIGDLLVKVLGKVFTYILIVSLIIVCLILLLEKSFFNIFKPLFKKEGKQILLRDKISTFFSSNNNKSEEFENDYIKESSISEETGSLNNSDILAPLEPLPKIEYARNKIKQEKRTIKKIDDYIFDGENKYKKIKKPVIFDIKKEDKNLEQKKILFAIDEINEALKNRNLKNDTNRNDDFNVTIKENIEAEIKDIDNKNIFMEGKVTENYFNYNSSLDRHNLNKNSENIASKEIIDYDIDNKQKIEDIFNKPPEYFLSEETDFSYLDKLNDFYNFENEYQNNYNIQPKEENKEKRLNNEELEAEYISKEKSFSTKEDKENNDNLNNENNYKEEVSNLKKNENYPYIERAEEEKIFNELQIDESSKNSSYQFPKLEFLNRSQNLKQDNNDIELRENSNILVKTLKSFNINSEVIKISRGPSVTRYELSIEDGIKVSKILGLDANIALSLAATSIRIEAPIPGKSAVGIEIPNKEVKTVFLSEVICSEKFQKFTSKLSFGLGKDTTGNVIVTDISKMPHMLIAGATGSGKSVCINTLITSILYKSNPDEVKLIMIDPKVVELSIYNGIPHLLLPVVTEPENAAGTLNWAVQEMMDRYNLFAEAGVRNITGYNEIMVKNGQDKLPQIVIIIDELADLMMVAAKEVENAICRIAQLARAAGMHLIIATQRPSVDVITGLIKANIPSRIAFAVSSGTDSRTVLDSVGAEKLLGKGDMLFKSVDMSKPLRIQGAFISDKEVETIVNFIKSNSVANYDESIINKIKNSSKSSESINSEVSDEITDEVISFLVKKGKASISLIQRQFRIGYNRAARIMEELEDRGIISSENGSKQREVLMDRYQFEEYMNRKIEI